MTVDRGTGGRSADTRSASTATAGATGAGFTGAGARGTGPRAAGLPPITPRPVNRPTPEEVDRHGDELFKKSIANLSRRLEERAQQASDPRAAAELRRAALLAYNAERSRRLKLLAGAGSAAVAVACIAWFVVAISTPDSEATAGATPTPPATKVETASAAPVDGAPVTPPVTTPPATPVATPAPPPASPSPDAAPPSTELPPPATAAATLPSAPTPSAPPPAAPTPTTPEPKVVPTTVASTNDPAPAAPPAAAPVRSAPVPPAAAAPATPVAATSAEVPLQRTEINEIQTRLYTFGFNPGPIDGAPGPMTQVAAMKYRAERGLPQTDAINRELLEALRQDPAPQVAQAPQPPRPAPRRAYVQRRSDDPFESLRIAGDKFGRWLQSLGNN